MYFLTFASHLIELYSAIRQAPIQKHPDWLRSTNSSISDNLLIHITPRPLFATLGRDSHSMPRFFCVFRSMLVWRGIAAQSRTACLTGSQMYPLPSDFQALFTFVFFVSFNLLLAPFNKVRTNFFFHSLEL